MGPGEASVSPAKLSETHVVRGPAPRAGLAFPPCPVDATHRTCPVFVWGLVGLPRHFPCWPLWLHTHRLCFGVIV